MKAYGFNSPERNTLGRFGTDDDFNAQGILISCLKDLFAHHRTDMMGHFRTLVKQQAEKLISSPDILETFTAVNELNQVIVAINVALAEDKKSKHNRIRAKLSPRQQVATIDHYTYGFETSAAAVNEAADTLGIDIINIRPDSACAQFIGQVRQDVFQRIDEGRIENHRKKIAELPEIISKELIGERTAPFSTIWLETNHQACTRQGASVRKNIEAVKQDICATLTKDLPETVQDVFDRTRDTLVQNQMGAAKIQIRSLARMFKKLAEKNSRKGLQPIVELQQAAGQALEQLHVLMSVNPNGFHVPPNIVSTVRLAIDHDSQTRRPANSDGKKRRCAIITNADQRRKVYHILSIIDAVNGDFYRLAKSYKEAPQLEELMTMLPANLRPASAIRIEPMPNLV